MWQAPISKELCAKLGIKYGSIWKPEPAKEAGDSPGAGAAILCAAAAILPPPTAILSNTTRNPTRREDIVINVKCL